MKQPIRVLLVEDSENDAGLIARKLRDCAIVTRCDRRETFDRVLAKSFDVALVDLDLRGFSGIEAIHMIREAQPETSIIIVTGSVGPREADAACEHGASRFFMKSMGFDGLDRAVKQAKELRDLKMMSVKNQRLEVLGDLAAGIVHDMNGVLQIFAMGVEALRTRINPMDEHILDLMDGASKRGGEMTKQILAFARGSNGTKFQSVTAEFLLTETGAIMRRTFPPNVRQHVATEIGTASVRCDATQIIQVLMNLAGNARDAMPNGGDLWITAQTLARAEGVAGPCVMFVVRDTGTGIPEEAMPRIWEPFFTTKPPGKGTGLGLHMVKNIVKDHHGVITVESEVGSGTTFKLLLPIAVPWTSAISAVEDEPLEGDGRTVLIVDDDTTIRELMGLLLENAGYNAIKAANGVEALNHFRGGNQIDALISDMMMPTMGGIELIEALQAQGVNVPTLLLSGYDSPQLPGTITAQVLFKPISRDTLLKALQRALKNASVDSGAAGE